MTSGARQSAALVGERVGNYRLVRLLGEGAMGAVYLGAHQTLERRAAIKVLKPELAASELLVQRFIDEARAVSRLGHPGLVEVLDFGTTEAGQIYSVMELLEGRDLSAELRRGGPLSPGQVAWVAQQVCDALAAVHAAGLVHRDLKPGNLFLARAGDVAAVKVLDFGIAKLLDRVEGESRTQTGHILGTPEYMAPEQAKGRADVDGRADLYALGCVLYELAGGRPPFRSDTVPGLLLMHVSEPLPPLAELAPQLPEALTEAICRCLAKEPGERWQSAAELGAAMAAWAVAPPPPELDREVPELALAPTSASGENDAALAHAPTSASGEGDAALALAPTSASGEGDAALAHAPTTASGHAVGATANPATAPTRMADAASIARGGRHWLGLGAVAVVAAIAVALALGGGGGSDAAAPAGQAADAAPTAAAPAADAAAPATNPYRADDPVVLAAGAAIYRSKCAGCHGPRGLGDGPDTPRGLAPMPFADAELPAGILDRYRFEIVRRGVDDKMPAFAGELSGDDIWKVITYVGTLAEPMPDATAEEIRRQPELTAELAKAGATLYRLHCRSCHGPRGEGDGRAARYLGRHPADLTAGVFKLRSTPKGELPTDADLFRTISRGMGVSGMPGFSRLPARERWALVAYLETLSPAFAEGEPTEVLSVPPVPPVTDAAVERGRAAFVTAGCGKCHGDDGRGEGPLTAELEDYRGEPIAPPDFAAPATFIGGDAPADMYRTLMTGISGTPMPAGSDFFGPDEAWDVIAYVRSLAAE